MLICAKDCDGTLSHSFSLLRIIANWNSFFNPLSYFTLTNGLRQQTVSAAKCAGIDAQASQGVQPLVRNGVTQNSPDIQTSGLFASQSAHTPVRRV